MIDELKLIQEIVGTITEGAIWVYVAYILYSLVKFGVTAFALFYIINKIVQGTFAHIKQPYTKQECESFKKERDDAVKRTEEVKHMYKILKEAKDAKSTSK